MKLRINKDRPFEELVGAADCWMVRRRLGALHVGNSYLEACRWARPLGRHSMYPGGGMPRDKVSVGLRRGLIKYILLQWSKNRQLYADVMGGGHGCTGWQT